MTIEAVPVTVGLKEEAARMTTVEAPGIAVGAI
jgi:hypothetical protein